MALECYHADLQSNSTPAPLPLFSGMNPVTWISEAEAYFLSHAISDEERFPYVIELFDDDAFYWFNGWYRQFDFVTWETFTTAMLDQFQFGSLDEHPTASITVASSIFTSVDAQGSLLLQIDDLNPEITSDPLYEQIDSVISGPNVFEIAIDNHRSGVVESLLNPNPSTPFIANSDDACVVADDHEVDSHDDLEAIDGSIASVEVVSIPTRHPSDVYPLIDPIISVETFNLFKWTAQYQLDHGLCSSNSLIPIVDVFLPPTVPVPLAISSHSMMQLQYHQLLARHLLDIACLHSVLDGSIRYVEALKFLHTIASNRGCSVIILGIDSITYDISTGFHLGAEWFGKTFGFDPGSIIVPASSPETNPWAPCFNHSNRDVIAKKEMSAMPTIGFCARTQVYVGAISDALKDLLYGRHLFDEIPDRLITDHKHISMGNALFLVYKSNRCWTKDVELFYFLLEYVACLPESTMPNYSLALRSRYMGWYTYVPLVTAFLEIHKTKTPTVLLEFQAGDTRLSWKSGTPTRIKPSTIFFGLTPSIPIATTELLCLTHFISHSNHYFPCSLSLYAPMVFQSQVWDKHVSRKGWISPTITTFKQYYQPRPLGSLGSLNLDEQEYMWDDVSYVALQLTSFNSSLCDTRVSFDPRKSVSKSATPSSQQPPCWRRPFQYQSNLLASDFVDNALVDSAGQAHNFALSPTPPFCKYATGYHDSDFVMGIHVSAAICSHFGLYYATTLLLENSVRILVTLKILDHEHELAKFLVYMHVLMHNGSFLCSNELLDILVDTRVLQLVDAQVQIGATLVNIFGHVSQLQTSISTFMTAKCQACLQNKIRFMGYVLPSTNQYKMVQFLFWSIFYIARGLANNNEEGDYTMEHVLHPFMRVFGLDSRYLILTTFVSPTLEFLRDGKLVVGKAMMIAIRSFYYTPLRKHEITSWLPKLSSFAALYGHQPPNIPRYITCSLTLFNVYHLEDKVVLKGGSNVMNTMDLSPTHVNITTLDPFKEPIPRVHKRPNTLNGSINSSYKQKEKGRIGYENYYEMCVVFLISNSVI